MLKMLSNRAAAAEQAKKGSVRKQTLQKMLEGHRMSIANDRDDKPVFLFKNAWEIGHVTEKFPDVKFRETREIVYEA